MGFFVQDLHLFECYVIRVQVQGEDFKLTGSKFCDLVKNCTSSSTMPEAMASDEGTNFQDLTQGSLQKVTLCRVLIALLEQVCHWSDQPTSCIVDHVVLYHN